MSRTVRLSLLGAAVCVLLLSSCADPDARLARDLDTLAADAGMHGWVRVQLDGEMLVDRSLVGIGDSLSRPGPETPLHIASLSKLLTQVAVLRLIDAGAVDPDAVLSDYRPNFRPPFGDSITVAQMMEMRTGLPRELDATGLFRTDLLDEHGFAGPRLDSIANLPRSAEPENGGGYSNLDYWLLGAVIEAATGEPVGVALRQLVLDPLGMDATGYRRDGLDPMDGFDLLGDGLARVERDLSLRYASGGFVSSTVDLHRLAASLLEPGFLTDESIARLFGPDSTPERLEIFGALPGQSHMLVIDPLRRLVVTAMNNVTLRDLDGMIRLRDRILAHVGIETEEERRPRRTVVLQPIDELSEVDALERCLLAWIPALESGDEEAIHAGVSRCGPDGAFAPDDPAWAELVRVRAEAASWHVAGWRRITDGVPRGVEVWLDLEADGKLALLLIPSESDTTLVENLMVKPDDMTWMGRGY